MEGVSRYHSDFRRQCTLWRPAVSRDAAVENRIFNPSFICPVGDTLRLSAKGNHVVHSCVAILLRSGRPVAIVRRVALGVFSTLNAMRWAGRFAHICVEVLKGHPSLANRDSHSSIAIVTNMIRVGTSLNHAPPSPMDRQVGESVCSHRFTSAVGFVATATDDVAFPQVSATMNALLTAFAMTSPVRSQLWAYFGKRENRQFSKGLSRDVFDARRGSDRITVSHDFVPLKQVVVRTASQLQLIGCLHFSTLAIGGPI